MDAWGPLLLSRTFRRRRSTFEHFPAERRLVCVCEKGFEELKNATTALQSVWACSHLAGRHFMEGSFESKIICCSVLSCLRKKKVCISLAVSNANIHPHWHYCLADEEHRHCSHRTPLTPVYFSVQWPLLSVTLAILSNIWSLLPIQDTLNSLDVVF